MAWLCTPLRTRALRPAHMSGGQGGVRGERLSSRGKYTGRSHHHPSCAASTLRTWPRRGMGTLSSWVRWCRWPVGGALRGALPGAVPPLRRTARTPPLGVAPQVLPAAGLHHTPYDPYDIRHTAYGHLKGIYPPYDPRMSPIRSIRHTPYGAIRCPPYVWRMMQP
jgi:hypothetical protein